MRVSVSPDTTKRKDDSTMTDLCRNGHDRKRAGVNARGACMECKREAARRFREARAAGVPLNERKRQARTDLGRTEIGGTD